MKWDIRGKIWAIKCIEGVIKIIIKNSYKASGLFMPFLISLLVLALMMYVGQKVIMLLSSNAI